MSICDSRLMAKKGSWKRYTHIQWKPTARVIEVGLQGTAHLAHQIDYVEPFEVVRVSDEALQELDKVPAEAFRVLPLVLLGCACLTKMGGPRHAGVPHMLRVISWEKHES